MRKCGREWAARAAQASRRTSLSRKRIGSISGFWTKRSKLGNSRGPAANRLPRPVSVEPHTSASESKDISTNFILILIWFGLRYLPSMGLAEPDRSVVVAWGFGECGTILLLLLGGSLGRLNAKKGFAVCWRSDKIIFQVSGGWFGGFLGTSIPRVAV